MFQSFCVLKGVNIKKKNMAVIELHMNILILCHLILLSKDYLHR